MKTRSPKTRVKMRLRQQNVRGERQKVNVAKKEHKENVKRHADFAVSTIDNY